MAQLKSGSTVDGKAIATEEYVQQNAPTPYDIAVTNGYIGTEEAYNSALALITESVAQIKRW